MTAQYCQTGQPYVVLMADDDPDDIELIAIAVADGALPSDFRSVCDGHQLLDYLHRRGIFADPALDVQERDWLHREGPFPDPAPDPSLILLDLNMPRCNGIEALSELKCSPYLCKIPIVILTTSDAERDRSLTAKLGANGFLTKPKSIGGLAQMTQVLQTMRSGNRVRHWYESTPAGGG